MRKLTFIIIILLMIMHGCTAVCIRLIHRANTYTEDVGTTEVFMENKMDMKLVMNHNKDNSKETVGPLKKMEQSDFDRIGLL